MIGTCQTSDPKQNDVLDILGNYFPDVLQQWEFRIENFALNNFNNSINICNFQKKFINCIAENIQKLFSKVRKF